ncbi:MAG: acetyltransferase [Phycisphaerales bacterium]
MTASDTKAVPLVVWGASGHALVVAEIVRRHSPYEIAGFIDSVDPSRKGEAFCDSTILGGEETLDWMKSQGILHVALGFGHCSGRLAVATRVRAMGFELPALVHPSAVIMSTAVVGEGTVVMAGAIVSAACQIGKACIINSGAIVCHECSVGDGTHICPGVSIGGRTRIGARSWIGIGSTLRDKLTIGEATLVGAGSVVVRDLPERVVAYGNPARITGAADSEF